MAFISFLFSFLFFIFPSEGKDLKTSTNCSLLVRHFEKKYNLPENLLQAVAIVESKKCPWAVSYGKVSRCFFSKSSALQFVKTLQSQGVKNISVGCMQINLLFHRKKFSSLDAALTPYQNIEYGARLIHRFYQKYRCWERAIRYYNSRFSSYNLPYKKKVYKVWQKIGKDV